MRLPLLLLLLAAVLAGPLEAASARAGPRKAKPPATKTVTFDVTGLA